MGKGSVLTLVYQVPFVFHNMCGIQREVKKNILNYVCIGDEGKQIGNFYTFITV